MITTMITVTWQQLDSIPVQYFYTFQNFIITTQGFDDSIAANNLKVTQYN